MSPELVRRYAAPVPRYTSYPAAPHFSRAVTAVDYRRWLTELPGDMRLSLYAHIPFCSAMCWYCGCTTKATRRYDPVGAYLDLLKAEIAAIGDLVPVDHRVTHMHWGGGSPNILSADDIAILADAHRRHFRVDEAAEFAVEIDPRGLDVERIAAFARAGVTRVSLGVQDFDPAVQAAINRVQSFDETRAAAEGFREHGIDALNVDLVYGLPAQTRASVELTATKVLALCPSRVAVFGYAHLPQRLPHQRLIAEAALPDAVERYAQAARIGRVLAGAGYRRIGLDHYARPDDELAAGRVTRNFQGYTTDSADAVIGLGASAIGRLPQGYVQNHASSAEYARCIAAGDLATSRGVALSDEDRMRALVIERLMCDMYFPAEELVQRFGEQARGLIAEAEALLEADSDKLIERDDSAFRVTPRGRPFVRSIAACFDAYLEKSTARHAPGV